MEDLLVYKLACELSDLAWLIFKIMDWHTKKIMGDQFIEAVDSFGANIAEGYGRYHYLDRIKFYYNARASLFEAKHWSNLLLKRGIMTKEQHSAFVYKVDNAIFHHNMYIKTCYSAKKIFS